MPRTIAELRRQEIVTVNYLFQMTEILSFNEYIEGRATEMREIIFQDWRQNCGLLGDQLTLQRMVDFSQKALEEYHPNPESILHPSNAHKAYAGLKELIRTASEVFVHCPGVLDRLDIDYREVVRNREARPAISKSALRSIIRMMLLDEESNTAANIYADDFMMNDNAKEIAVSKPMVWKDVEGWLYGDGVVGITEQMSDVRSRGELSVLIAMLDRAADR